MKDIIEIFENLQEKDLLGSAAHHKMMVKARKYGVPPETNPIHAAVAICLNQLKTNTYQTILIKRSSHPLDKHKGQISFPGGRIESNESITTAALRELEEEVGISRNHPKILSKITPLYIPVSNFMVHPVIVQVSLKSVRLTPQASEVDQILLPQISHFANPKTFNYSTIAIRENFSLKNVPSYVYEDHIIWGATSMILQEVLDIIYQKTNQ